MNLPRHCTQKHCLRPSCLVHKNDGFLVQDQRCPHREHVSVAVQIMPRLIRFENRGSRQIPQKRPDQHQDCKRPNSQNTHLKINVKYLTVSGRIISLRYFWAISHIIICSFYLSLMPDNTLLALCFRLRLGLLQSFKYIIFSSEVRLRSRWSRNFQVHRL